MSNLVGARPETQEDFPPSLCFGGASRGALSASAKTTTIGRDVQGRVVMERNRTRIISTNNRMEDGVFVHSLSIRGWWLGAAEVNAIREVQSQTQEELRPLSGRASLPSVWDTAFKGEL